MCHITNAGDAKNTSNKAEFFFFRDWCRVEVATKLVESEISQFLRHIFGKLVSFLNFDFRSSFPVAKFGEIVVLIATLKGDAELPTLNARILPLNFQKF